MNSASPHDSQAQRNAESDILATLSSELGTELRKRNWGLADGVKVQVDGVNADASVFVEVYARIGRLKGAQLQKVAKDVLKLSLIRTFEQSMNRQPTLMLVFASEEARGSVTGWVRHAAAEAGIDLRVVEPSTWIREEVLAAQAQQVMVGIAQVTDSEDV